MVYPLNYASGSAPPPSAFIIAYRDRVHPDCKCVMKSFCRVAIGPLRVSTEDYVRGRARPTSAVRLTVGSLGTRYVHMTEIVECSSCKILLLVGSEIKVFGTVGAADSIRFMKTSAPMERVIFDMTQVRIFRATPLYIIPSVKPEWCHPVGATDELSYVFSKTNDFERD